MPRSFPLFFYGQHYTLGVEAWMYLTTPPPSPHRTLSDHLTKHPIKYA